MRVLAIDIGSSSVKAAVLRSEALPRRIARVPFATLFKDDGLAPRAEVKLASIDRAIQKAIAQLGSAARHVDLIAATTMSPSWLALDEKGKPLTNVVTHQDRRSIAEAAEIERRVGKARHLKLAGNRPFPGGISSTTCAWHLAHKRSAMKRAALVGHLGTWLAFTLTGERVIDLSNAGFTGLMDIGTSEWSDTLIDAAGVDRSLLPQIVASDAAVGTVTTRAARHFGITQGTPLLAGCIDGSAAMLAAGGKSGVKPGQIVNVCGSTDVLAVCADEPHPHEDLLTRPLGVDGKWLSVGTIAAAGSAIEWVHKTFFRERSAKQFFSHLDRIARGSSQSRVRFDALLAGSRTSMTLLTGTLNGLALSSDRDDIARALFADLSHSAETRFKYFADAGVRLGRDALVSGGGAALMKPEWPTGMLKRTVEEATLRGLWQLASRSML